MRYLEFIKLCQHMSGWIKDWQKKQASIIDVSSLISTLKL